MKSLLFHIFIIYTDWDSDSLDKDYTVVHIAVEEVVAHIAAEDIHIAAAEEPYSFEPSAFA